MNPGPISADPRVLVALAGVIGASHFSPDAEELPAARCKSRVRQPPADEREAKRRRNKARRQAIKRARKKG